MRVIINADDFGYSHEVNDAIKKAIEEKRISSTTIMANAPCYEEAIEIARNNNNVSYGVHLNLIEFKPLTNSDIFRKYNLVNETGSFIEGAIFCLSNITEELKRAIREEWISQILKVKESKIPISHLDSHQHVHALPALQEVIISVMEEMSIHKCRRRGYMSIAALLRSKGFTGPHYDKSKAAQPKKKNIFVKISDHLVKMPIKQMIWLRNMKKTAIIPDGIFSYQYFVQDTYNHKCLSNNIVELECHPGLTSNVEETAMVMSDFLREKLPDYILVNYNDL